uniref:F-box/kelch-repeat protein n=1 Tax=Noccaea caerulescens TaxID=107243 RepID=A0A1J3GG80_NOCCA
MANDSSPASDFSRRKYEDEAPNEARKDAVYKTKEITFRGEKKRIIIQDENGPCPLIAICNVLLLLRNNKMDLDWNQQVSEERLLRLFDTDRDDEEYNSVIKLLPCFAEGMNVNVRFRRIDDFVLTPELHIFSLLKIALYHGWIVDPEDIETAAAIGCKSYDDLMTELVTLKAQTVNAPSGQISGECSVDPLQRCSRERSVASAEHSKLGHGDREEERELQKALLLSKMGFDTSRDSSSEGEFSSKVSEDETGCDVENKINEGEEVLSTTSTTKTGTELGDETVDDAETVQVTLEKTYLVDTTKNDSSSEIQLKSVNPDLTGRSQDVDVPLYEADKGGSLGSPVYEGESLVGQSSPEGKDTNGLTQREGQVIKNFLYNNASQLTSTGLVLLEAKLKEGEICVFFRNNHFYTLLKHDNALYNLVTDAGYEKEVDVVWETLQVDGDSVFMTGDFKASLPAISNTTSFLEMRHDISLEILARVPKRLYPVLSCVSKNVQNLQKIRSQQIQKIRRSLDKDSIYFCLADKNKIQHRWFSLRANKSKPDQNVFAAEVLLPDHHPWSESDWHSMDMFGVGSKILLVAGLPISVWIVDTKTLLLQQVPDVPIGLKYRNAALVGGEILYLFGDPYTAPCIGERYRTQAHRFNLQSQTWSEPFHAQIKSSTETLTLGEKIYMFSGNSRWRNESFDPVDRSFQDVREPFRSPVYGSACVMQQVIYYYDFTCGLKWYDTATDKWQWVDGSLEEITNRQMAGYIGWIALREYYGQLVLVWAATENPCGGNYYTRCRMINIERTATGIRGELGPVQDLGTIPPEFSDSCLSVSLSRD